MRILYVFFLIAIFLDLIISPSIGAMAWFPKFTLALIPFVFLFAKKNILWPIFFVFAFILWLTTGINLGIITFALGLTLFFERWLLPKSFHKNTWQSLVVSALGVLSFGIIIWIFTIILTPEKDFFNSVIVISFILTTILAIGINFVFYKKIYSHE